MYPAFGEEANNSAQILSFPSVGLPLCDLTEPKVDDLALYKFHKERVVASLIPRGRLAANWRVAKESRN